MFHYFVPMLVDEFNNLLRLGNMQVPVGRWLYARPGKPNDADQASFVDEIREITPSFEDTISIVIVEFSTCVPFKPKRHSLYEFSFTDAVATYALTYHDRDVLNSRLGSVANLSKELLIDEKFIQYWKKELSEIRSLQGAKSLLTIYQGSGYHSSTDNLLLKSELLKALDLRGQYLNSPISGGSYLDNLICYSRSGIIPNSDTGFFYDAMCILEYYLDKKFSRNKADHYHKQNFSFIPMVNDLIDSGDARKFDGYVDLPGALVSSLVFLKLCHEIREHNQSLNREWLRNLLSPIHDQASVARGVWWCGGFWGFTPFAEEYYAIASLPETPEPRFPENPPAPPAREPVAPAPDSTIGESIAANDTPTPDAPLVATPVEPVQETPEVVDVTVEPIPGSASVTPEMTAPAPEVSTEPEQPVVETPAVSPTEAVDTAGVAEQADMAGAADRVPVQPNPAPAAPPDVPGSRSDLLGSEVPAPTQKTSGKGKSTRGKSKK